MAERLGLRLRRIFSGARAFEGVAALHDLALDVSCGARRSAEVFEAVVMRLELAVRDAPVLDRHVRRQEVLAVAFGEVRLEDEVARQEAPHFRVPVHAATLEAGWRHET